MQAFFYFSAKFFFIALFFINVVVGIQCIEGNVVLVKVE